MNAINMQNKALSCLLFLGIGVIASGCASKRAGDIAPSMDSQTELVGDSAGENSLDATSLIAYDFARVVSQVRVLSPTQITLSILPDANDDPAFTEALRLALFKLNYAVRIGDANDSSVELTHKVRTLTEEESGIAFQQPDDAASVYQVNVGDISLRRRYSLQGSGVVLPLTPMEGRGLQGANLVVDDSIFERGRQQPARTSELGLLADKADETMESSASAEQSGRFVDETSMPASGGAVTAAPVIPDQEANVSFVSSDWDANTESAGTQSIVPTVATIAIPELALEDTVNYRELGKSNFQNTLDNTVLVGKEVIAFPNDSSELIALSEAKLESLVNSYQGSLDIISVIGTSHGRAQFEGAQEILARERASAITESLLAMGIDRERIFVEASWSETYFDDVMPRRAAVVEIRRPITSSVVN